MAKRKSEKGIVLQKGESQLADGRYRYRYYDDVGKAHDVYSWRLRPEDPAPEGRKPGKSLRELEKEIQRGIEDGLKIWDAAGLTVEKLVNEYIDSQRPYWKPNTLQESGLSFHHVPTHFNKTPKSLANKEFAVYSVSSGVILIGVKNRVYPEIYPGTGVKKG